MALTATASKTLQYVVSKIIGLKDPFILSICPSKKNLIYHVGHCSNVTEAVTPLIDHLSKKRTNMPRVIIYCRTFEDCSDIYLAFRESLGSNFIEPPDAPTYFLIEQKIFTYVRTYAHVHKSRALALKKNFFFILKRGFD